MRTDRTPTLREPDLALFREMLRLALGQELPEASIDVARQHGGFTPRSGSKRQLRRRLEMLSI